MIKRPTAVNAIATEAPNAGSSSAGLSGKSFVAAAMVPMNKNVADTANNTANILSFQSFPIFFKYVQMIAINVANILPIAKANHTMPLSLNSPVLSVDVLCPSSFVLVDFHPNSNEHGVSVGFAVMHRETYKISKLNAQTVKAKEKIPNAIENACNFSPHTFFSTVPSLKTHIYLCRMLSINIYIVLFINLSILRFADNLQ